MKDNKQLMFCMSVDLTKSEALGFAQTMTTDEPYFIYKTRENPQARDWPKRESWVVCRPQRKGEMISGAYVLWVDSRELIPILPSPQTIGESKRRVLAEAKSW